MKITIIGTGYVGLSVGCALASIGHKVFCLDKDEKKLENIKNGNIPIFEPDLEDFLKKAEKKGNIEFTVNAKEAISDTEICFITVGTPSLENGEADESAVIEAIHTIGKYLNKYAVIVNKSTVPIGSAHKTKQILKSLTNVDFDVISNPEFLRQGSALKDFLNPERIILGLDNIKALNKMYEMYEPLKLPKEKFVIMDEKSAETVKYASNAFLAVKISYINELAMLCEKTGADIDKVSLGMGFDSRIGNKFLNAGIGFGGSCFPKDVKALINTAHKNDINLTIVESAKKANEKAKKDFIDKVLNYFNYNIRGKKIAIWGLAFKPNTNDLREAPSIPLIQKLLEYGANITAYDPKAKNTATFIFKDKIKYATTKEEALNDSNALILVTEWDEFKKPDFKLIAEKLSDKVVFDGRNQYNKEELQKYNLDYICVGK